MHWVSVDDRLAVTLEVVQPPVVFWRGMRAAVTLGDLALVQRTPAPTSLPPVSTYAPLVVS